MSVQLQKRTIKYVKKTHPKDVYKRENICYNFSVKKIVADFFIC